MDAVVGGMGASDGVVLRELARRYPTVPFLVAGTSVREATAHDPAPNLYRFSSDVEQDQAGLATYAYRTLGWRQRRGRGGGRRPTAGARVAAFSAEFCALGGSVQRIWTPLYGAPGPLLKQVPAAVDGVVVLAAFPYGTPAAFIRAYLARHPDAKRSLLLGLLGLSRRSRTATTRRCGPSCAASSRGSSGIPDPSPADEHGVPQGIRERVPGPAAPACRAIPSCCRTTPRSMRCCRRSRASTATLGADRGALRTALASLRLETPTGPVRLDGNRQAVVPATLVRLTARSPGPPRSSRCSGSPRSTRRSAACFAARRPRPAALERVLARATPPPWAR